MIKKNLLLLFTLFAGVSLLYVACNVTEATQAAVELPDPDPRNGDIHLLPGFGALIVADSIGRGRHLDLSENGDVYVRLRQEREADSTGLVALRDTTGDGKADIIHYFGHTGEGGTGLDVHQGHLYFSSRTQVFRMPMQKGQLAPDGEIETVVTFPDSTRSGHSAKPFTFDNKGFIYVTSGSRSNACQETARSPLSPGKDPCPELPHRAAIWKFSLDKLDQLQSDGTPYATGIRNAVALDWNFNSDKLYALQHGRDDLHRFWPEKFTPEENRDLPSEEFLMIDEGDNFGWPYCYYDHYKNKKLLAPEYGGDGKTQGRCEDVPPPIAAFPAHLAPNDLVFYNGDQFPERYKNGAFIAFHGSWNRLGFNQAGYSVYFIPMKDGLPSGDWEVFASGFEGPSAIQGPNRALFRPTGLAIGSDGSLYICDSRKGRIWRVMYYGEKILPNAEAAERLVAENKPEPTEVPAELAAGKKVYDQFCLACHMDDGTGVPGMNPPLVNTDWVLGDKERPIKVVLNGLSEPVEINGEIYQNAMAPHNFLDDQQIADVLTFVRQSFGNKASAITAEEVAEVRNQEAEQTTD